MIIGFDKLKEKDGVLPKISVVLYNFIFYGYFVFLIINFLHFKNFNALTIGIAVLLPINFYLTLNTMKNFSSKRKSHIGSFDFFMNSIRISKKSIMSFVVSEFSKEETGEGFLAVFLIYFLMFCITLGISSGEDSTQGGYIACLLIIAIPSMAIVNNLFNCDIFNTKEVPPNDLIKFEKVEDINEDEKNKFKDLLNSVLSEKGCITKKDVYDAYIIVSENKKYRLAEEKNKTESEALKRKIENAKEEYIFLTSENNQ